MKDNTIQVSSTAGIRIDDIYSVSCLDPSKLKRLWYFLTFRRPPTIETHFRVTDIQESNTLEIAPCAVKG